MEKLLVNEKDHLVIESDDEDSGSYFLQPASYPYNIQDKVKEANAALLNENCSSTKFCKVKFSSELVDYEPEMSDDNLSSIVSEDNVDYLQLHDETMVLESQLQAALILNVAQSDEENEIEEIIEEVYEEVTEIAPFKQISTIQSEVEDIRKHEMQSENEQGKHANVKKKCAVLPKDINCKNHCIERFEGDISITKINLQHKSYDCPPLKLQKRNCCDKNTTKTFQKLPYYGGFRSEYGLTAVQLQNRDRLQQIIKLRQQERQKILEENKKRRLEQNELIFSDWLNSVSKRKTIKTRQRTTSTPLSSTVLTFQNSPSVARERPKTSYQSARIKHTLKKKRPNTSSCILIEVPPNVLNNGLQIGDLLVTRDKKIDTKMFHFFSLK